MPDIDCLEYMCQLAQGNLWLCQKIQLASACDADPNDLKFLTCRAT